jgi:hypothetical protein
MVETLLQKKTVVAVRGLPRSQRRERSHEHPATAFVTP